MSDVASPQPPPGPLARPRRTLEQRLELARLAETRAAERLTRKARKVQQYESVAKTRERKLDTRRKITVGALAWEHRNHDSLFNRALMKLLDDYVLRDDERALVGLPPQVRDKALEAFKTASLSRRRGRKAGVAG